MKFRLFISLFIFGLLSPAPGQTNVPGLVCTATDGERNVIFRVPTPNFTLHPGQSIHPQLKPEFFAQWNGFLKIERAGKYVVHGDAAVFVGGKEIQNQTNHFEAGDLPLKINYTRKPGGARLQLAWSSEFFKYEPIPAGAFSHGDANVKSVAARLDAVDQSALGRELFENYNCSACHKSETSLIRPRAGPDLSDIGSRVSANWIEKWLENPRHYRTNAPMPVLLKTPQIRADVTAFLAGLKSDQPLPNITADKLQSGAGNQLFQNIGCATCHGDDSLKGVGSKMNPSQIAHYLLDPLRVDPSGRMPDMALSADEAAQLAAYLAESKDARFEAQHLPGNPERGKQFFKIIGCANCHDLQMDGAKIQPAYLATPFEKLKADRGCIADKPPGFAPDYHLDAAERDALNAFVANPDRSEAPVQDVARTLKQFNCVACHEFNSSPKNHFEGPHSPPPLSEAGNKLRRSWLDLVLHEKKRARPWMTLRMPHYGKDTLTNLLDGFAACTGAELGEGPSIAKTTVEQVSEGVRLLGKDHGGLACISCHDYNGQPAGAEMRGPDLTEIFDRTRADWLRRWMRDPSRIKPGTAMPGFFTGMADGDANHKITQIMYALSAGKNMPAPSGLNESEDTYQIRVEDEPVIFRGFFTDASPRSLAVGLPGGFSYMFDAENCRFRYAWSGAFIDARATWRDRGGMPARVLGEKFYTAPDVFPLRFSPSTEPPKTKFLGYKLRNGAPEFSYEIDGIVVRELVSCHPARPGLVRTFAIQAPPQEVRFHAGPELKVSENGQPLGVPEDGWVVLPKGVDTFNVFVPAKAFPVLKPPNTKPSISTGAAAYE